jgi:RNA polymerase sigma-B factor
MDTEELIRTHLPLVDSIARRYRGRGEPFEDLRQCGALGLVLAAKRWDPGRGVTFGAYAAPVVAGEIRRHLRDHGRLVRLPRRIWESAGRCRGAARELTAVLGRAPTTEEIAAHVGMEPSAVIEAMTASAWPAALDEVTSDQDFGPMPTPDHRPRLDVMGALRPGQRRLLELVAVDRQSQRQIARLYGVSQAQVSRALTSAVAEVRRLIDEEGASDQDSSDRARVLAGCRTQPNTAAPMTRPQIDSAMAS